MAKIIVCFPFYNEKVKVIERNILRAGAYSAVREILCVGKEKNGCYQKLSERVPALQEKTKKKITLLLQKKYGSKRSGKGDGMLTALEYFLKTPYDRIHFYDSDITNFSKKWIERVERKSRQGFDVVRCFYPRSSTDAQITWHITRTGFAILWPQTEICFIRQPLGGELALQKKAVKKIFKKILNFNDWGIDTAITFFSFFEGCSIYEVYIKEGKLHKYYDSLEDLKTMCIECFSTLQELKKASIKNTSGKYVREDIKRRVSPKVKTKLSYKIEKTLFLLKKGWTRKQLSYLKFFPKKVQKRMKECQNYPRFSFMTKKTWFETFKILVEKFKKGDKDWEELLFKLWVARVLDYTLKIAIKGYNYALDYLEKMIEDYKDWSLCNNRF